MAGLGSAVLRHAGNRFRFVLMKTSFLLPFIFGQVLGSFACGHNDMDPPIEATERFVGQWLISETEPHALYGESLFRFAADGSVAMIWDAGLYGEMHSQGHVRHPSDDLDAPVCFFGASWHSIVSERMVIEGACSDNIPRPIELYFVSDAAANSAGATVEIVDVGGETGWLPPRWGWKFKKCQRINSSPGDCGALTDG